MRVFWTPDAKAWLREIETYIAEDSPKAARDTAVRLIRRSLELERPPLVGKQLARYAPADVRELLERPYRLIYRVLADRIEIITVLHYRQLMPSDLAGPGKGRAARSDGASLRRVRGDRMEKRVIGALLRSAPCVAWTGALGDPAASATAASCRRGV